jgi:hypothetical protein
MIPLASRRQTDNRPGTNDPWWAATFLASSGHLFRRRREQGIYGITAFAGFEAAAALSEEARSTRRFRDEFRLWRHLLLPATAAVLMLFPL